MMMARTRSGRDPFECMSVVQKSIRRGDEKLACQYAYEMGASSPSYRSMILNYLIENIPWEDVGPADPAAVILAITAFNQSIEFCKRSKDTASDLNKERWSLPMYNGIIALCRCRKTRIAAHMSAVVGHEKLPDVPDHCHDMHTSVGKSKGRGIDHFLDNLRMHNEVPEHSTLFPDPYKDAATAIWRKTKSEKVPEHVAPVDPPADADDGRGVPKGKKPAKAPVPAPTDAGLFDSHEDGVEVTG